MIDLTPLLVLVNFFLFPGLAFSFLVSWFSYWTFRKLRARLQARQGPPWYQPVIDLVKLFSKETIIPVTAQRAYFVLSPLLALSSLLLTLMLIPIGFATAPLTFIGDLVAVIYLLLVFSVSTALAGSASGSPYGAIGASRELSIIIGYEVVFAAGALVPALVAKSLLLSDIIASQAAGNWMIFRFPFGAVAVLLCIAAKLKVKPFDMPDAKQEIVAGPFTEYTGPLLGVWYLAKMLSWFVLSALYVNLFLGGGDALVFPLNLISFLVKCFVVVVLMTLIDVANARYRIDQAFSRFLTFIFILALIDIIRYWVGAYIGWW
ncbi:MAG: complex I subunit 1 family protein [Nitrososphaerales archaeon]